VTGATVDAVSPLTLKRAPIGPHQEEYEVLEDGIVVGRVFLMPIGLKGRPWMWTIPRQQGPHTDARIRANARRRDGCIR
jgi:hypothetical protein